MGTSQAVIRLTGPRGTFHNGETVARSQITRLSDRACWQWAAFDPEGKVLHVVEMPFVLRDVCDTESGALWALRGIAAHHLSPD